MAFMLRTLIQSFFSKGLVATISFFILIVSSKFLGVSTRGEISLIILNLAIMQMVNEIYTGYSLVHFAAKYNVHKIFNTGVLFTLIVTGVSNMLLFTLNIQPQGYFFHLLILSVIMILNTFNCVLILAKENYRMYNFLSVIQPLLLFSGILFYTQVLRNYTLSAYVMPLLFSFIISFLISTIFTLKKITLVKQTNQLFELKPILINGFFCQAAVLMHVLSGKLCYYLLETKPDVGLYSTSNTLIESVMIITNSVTPILLSKVANQSVNTSVAKFSLIFAKLCFLFSIMAVGIIYVIPQDFFAYLLGDSFRLSKKLMLILSPGIIMLSFSGIISHYFSGIGNLKIVSFYNFFGFMTSLILALLLVKDYGIYGAAIATNASYLITFLLSLFIFMKKNRIKPGSLIGISEDINELKKIFSGK